MEKIELEIFGLSSSQSQTGSFALVLGEVTGKRRLPIIIGMFEAQAIAVEIEKIPPKRPMTHDLFKSMCTQMNVEVKEIIISDLKEGVFFANILIDDGIKTVEIDSRPSDAVALALRFDVPIYTYEKVLGEAGIIIAEEESELEDDEMDIEMEDAEVESEESSGKSDYSTKNIEELNQTLQDAIKNEDYERAAKIRDELQKRGSN